MLIIGGMKCGTVSLHRYLAIHPQIAMTSIHEVDFFVKELNWPKGLAWYETHFETVEDVVGERSTSYSKYPTFDQVPERIKSIIPEVKILYTVRDPIDRIVSHYRHFYRRGYERRSFEDAIGDLSTSIYLLWSSYYLQMDRYLSHFSPDKIHVVDSRELLHNRRKILREIFQFLDVSPEFWHPDFEKLHHRTANQMRPTLFKKLFGTMKGAYKLEAYLPRLFSAPIPIPEVTTSMRYALDRALEPDMKRFRDLTGDDFDHWSV